MSFINRKEIKDLGASDYLINKITKNLIYKTKIDRKNYYKLTDVLEKVCELIGDKKIQEKTRNCLNKLEINISTILISLDTKITKEMQGKIQSSVTASITAKHKIREAQKSIQSTLKNCTDPLVLVTTIGKNNIVQKSIK